MDFTSCFQFDIAERLTTKDTKDTANQYCVSVVCLVVLPLHYTDVESAVAEKGNRCGRSV